MKLHLGLALSGLLGLGVWAAGPARAGGEPVTDGAFIADVITHSAYEARASELALARAKAEEVRKFARKVLAQEKALGPALTGLAVENDIPVRFNRVRGRQPAQTRLAAVRDGRFDETYLRCLTQDLKEWIDLARRCAAGPGGAAERDLAAKMLPALRQRLKEANGLMKTVR
jgi:predicted outer membrane protein